MASLIAELRALRRGRVRLLARALADDPGSVALQTQFDEARTQHQKALANDWSEDLQLLGQRLAAVKALMLHDTDPRHIGKAQQIEDRISELCRWTSSNFDRNGER